MTKKKPQKKSAGTRFRIFVLPRYANALELTAEPETITVSVPTSKIKEGPADDRMYVVDAINKLPYDDGEYPPYRGPVRAPVKPGPGGHFDHLGVNTRDFLCATMYATVRRTLDIWEGYFFPKGGGRLPWHFRLDYARLELIPAVAWDNAQSGWGFLEFGYGRAPGGGPDTTKPYCENFDVLAHEMGHTIVFSTVGFPRDAATDTIYYGGFHESAADLVSIVASLHFEKILDHLLKSSKGNLFSNNELTRIGEVSQHEQIRMALNYEKMSTVGDEPHDLSQPLTGAIFDIFVEVFQKELVKARLITQELADEAAGPEGGLTNPAKVQPKFDAAYQGKHEPFKKCLKAARDYLGSLLAETWRHLSPDYLDYGKIANALLDADERLTGGEHAETVRSCFRWRQISVADGALALRRFSIEDCRPPASGRQRRVRSHPMARFAADGDAGSLDELLGSRVHDYCRSPDHDKSFIGLGPTYKQFKKMTLAEFTLHTTNFPTSGERDLALDQFATGLNDWLRGYGYVPSPGAKGAVREVAKSKESTVLQLLAAVQSNYSL